MQRGLNQDTEGKLKMSCVNKQYVFSKIVNVSKTLNMLQTTFEHIEEFQFLKNDLIPAS